MSVKNPKHYNFYDISEPEKDKLIVLFDEAYCALEQIFISVDIEHKKFRDALMRVMNLVDDIAADFEDSKLAGDGSNK